ncbi:Ribonuclease III [hydrothermal vent metagenome]|uniref:ribonuclease III n=1 Tax=hydrothermal vent metagenome TaxID=652676 RepID=A0A3B0ZCR6_9ZZZZ
MDSRTKFLKIIEYTFNDIALLDSALTHRSAASNNNERLEFLGDSVLGLVISSELYKRFVDIDEGVLSRLRASLVKGETLAELAKEINLGEYIQLGSGELKSGGFRRASILADAFEAVIGAIYLDGGIQAATKFILSQYQTRLSKVNPSEVSKDPKTRLQEYLQARSLPLPVYTVIAIDGESHQQSFTVTGKVAVVNSEIKGSGKSRRFAEQQVAQKILDLLIND